MKKYIITLLLLFFARNIFAADINATIVDANSTYYKVLLQNIAKKTTDNEDLSLQKTLLSKLVKFSNQSVFKAKKIAPPQTQDAYATLFATYIEDLLQKERLEKNLEHNEDKADALKSQIEKQSKPLLTTQLFYAFYMKSIAADKKAIGLLSQELKAIKATFEAVLHTIPFQLSKLTNELQIIDKKIKITQNKLESLAVKRERYTLLNKTALLQTVDGQMNKLETTLQDLKEQKLTMLFVEFSRALAQKEKKAFALHKNIIAALKSEDEKYNALAESLDELLTSMEKVQMGTVETMKAKGFEEIQIQTKNLWKIANAPIFSINKTPVSSFKLFIALFIFFVGYLVAKFYKSSISKLSSKNRNVNLSTLQIVNNLGTYTIFLVTFFIVLKVLGIDLSSIALVAGALSVGIGFGLQNIISNFVSGIIIMVEHSVKIGDYIQLDDTLRGHVTDIRMRSITVNTNANIDVIVPNQELIQNRVINWTMKDKIRRFEIPFGVAYGSDAKKVISVILEAVKESGFSDIYTTQKRHTRVIMTGMGDSSVNFELFVWVEGKEILFPKRTTSRFLVLIYETLNANGIEIPFPQQDLHIRSVSDAIPVTFKKEKE